MTISEKAKTTKQFCDELSPSCILDCPLEDKLSQVDCSICEKEEWVLVSVAEQEIDKFKTFRDNAVKKWCDSQAELERERGLLKQKQRPHKILCLVGSTSPNWKNRYRKVLVELTKAGYICQTVVWFKDELENFEKHRDLLESIHFQKVRMSEAVILIHKDAVGKHTTMEMEYAKSLNMPVVTFENVEQCKKDLEELLRK